MKTKLFLISLLLSTFSMFSKPVNPSLGELRSQYLKALSDYLNAPKVYDLFLSVEEPSAKMLAYQGALEAIMTKTTWNVFKKMSYLNKCEESFQKAIQLSPYDLEIRYMRLAVQFEIPGYLGFSDDMETDKKFILKHVNNLSSENIPESLKDQIISFMNRCEMFTSSEIEKVKVILIP